METPTQDVIKSVMQELARRGGKSTSRAKQAAARRNLLKARRVRLGLKKVKRTANKNK